MIILAWCVLIGIPSALLIYLLIIAGRGDGCAMFLLAAIVAVVTIILILSSLQWAIKTIFG